ncbi:hypothetical protein EW093_12575 [Thiospirochaeta perfilievii]|uniref:Uncharacterized protein n=1 Tax=Thiospirochaeta perfilievii TaxID=252967 RepID=A0A5C1QFY8_9SPIO|nr:hypothetical protein [Thiospirochaeta perfilievii]QEN05514.1 hypothetical protein EW093_12575 [Thiospirochaeta perfilievii]
MGKKDNVIKFHKVIGLQLYGYLAMIPFLFALLTLINNYKLSSLIQYSIGLIFILVLLLINHLDPEARVTKDKILLYNTFHNHPVVLYKKDFVSYEKINSRLVKFTFNNKSYELKLNKRELIKFVSILEDLS